MRYGYAASIGFFLCAAIVLGLNVFLLRSDGTFMPKFLAFGMVLLGMALILIPFPGGNVPFKELKDRQRAGEKGLFWKLAPMLHRVMWIITIAVSIGFGVWLALDLEHGGPLGEWLLGLLG